MRAELLEMGPWTKPKGPAGWAVVALALLMGLLGAILLAGGVWLIWLGGSWYYALAGMGLIASAIPLAWRARLGAWIYYGVFAATLVWALAESGLNGWALLPRLGGPFVILLAVIASAPVLAGPEARRFQVGSAAAAAALLLVGGAAIALTSTPDDSRPLPPPGDRIAGLPSGGAAGQDWPVYAGDEGAAQFSTLTQITPDNVDGLERAWVFRTGDIPGEKWGAETTPIKVGDTMYLCTARNILLALDPVTGQERWRYDPKVEDRNIPYTAACRGVTYHALPSPAESGDCATRIVEGTLDGRLIAVDAATGQPCAGFGRGGSVDITEGMGDTPPGMVSITSPPVIVRGVIVTGHQVLDGQRRMAPSGVVQGFDLLTGKLRWAWDLARPGETSLPEGETYTRGTPNMWTMATGDEEYGQVYLPMGNSAVDYWSSTRRPESDRYATSLVALNVATGQPVWNFQTVHIDVWDYDLGSQPTLIDWPGEQGPVPAVVLASKQGDIYILDRRTGEPLTGVEERPVPQGGVEPERRSPTQPFSAYHTLAKRELKESDMWGMSPIDQMFCRIQFRQASYDGMYTPPTTDTRWIQYPGYNGGSDWGGVAVDPSRGLLVANYNDTPNYNRLVPREEANRRGWVPRDEARGGSMGEGPEGAGDPQAGTPFAIDVNAGWRMKSTGLLCKQPPYGGIRVIDLLTGETIWDRPLGQARRNGPWGIPSMLPLTIGTPNNGGPLVTASGLVFIAAATDDLIRAIDIRTGKTVWTDTLPAGGQATPMTYEAEGRQYVVIMAGGHHFMETPPGDHVVAYALP